MFSQPALEIVHAGGEISGKARRGKFRESVWLRQRQHSININCEFQQVSITSQPRAHRALNIQRARLRDAHCKKTLSRGASSIFRNSGAKLVRL